jgi:hypothetical protein
MKPRGGVVAASTGRNHAEQPGQAQTQLLQAGVNLTFFGVDPHVVLLVNRLRLPQRTAGWFTSGIAGPTVPQVRARFVQ